MIAHPLRLARRALFAAFVLVASTTAFAADRAVFQVTEADEAKWNLVLNNARNLQNGAEPGAEIEIVAYGPGVMLLKAGSPIAARIAEAANNRIKVVACRNTMAANRLVEGDMLPDIGYVPAGVVEVMRKQQQGFAYIRP
jgi:intracellular sulfur oxidation DsrE/DsrF family protein